MDRPISRNGKPISIYNTMDYRTEEQKKRLIHFVVAIDRTFQKSHPGLLKGRQYVAWAFNPKVSDPNYIIEYARKIPLMQKFRIVTVDTMHRLLALSRDPNSLTIYAVDLGHRYHEGL